MNNVAAELRKFVVENYLFGQTNVEFKDEDSFLQKGIIDSTGVLELIAFLEEKYQIKIEDEEVVPANLDSVENVTRFIGRKLAAI